MGLEPTHLAVLDPKSSASTNSAILAWKYCLVKTSSFFLKEVSPDKIRLRLVRPTVEGLLSEVSLDEPDEIQLLPAIPVARGFSR